jgi:putative ABC transport system ATP-binding protein
MDDVIRALGLCKTYRSGAIQSPALRGVDLRVARGDCVFLAGPSGSGKTTLLSILGCVLSPDAGELEILGENVSRFTPSQQARFRRERIGFVFQRFHLFEALTAIENVAVPLKLLGWAGRQASERSRELLEVVGLEGKAASRVTQLSTGQRQRVAFARALAGRPEIILADEPTASLDGAAGANAMRMLKDLCREFRTTVLVVTHDERIFPLANRILYLSDGQLVRHPNMRAPVAAAGNRA